ncbi:Pyruvate phosphate dikinase [Sulfitobacter donghicola DSW-25 = KCTC 12864 = JCM 14565]|uniref:Pyruvate, phosphate dikinase n=1 Tax=Sulfitobacter donghicola DSW-25 = KCTC 12864 = JCM 14565 TaxID=1300350 RepID=A0A073IXE8_9RHOB|nr:pyruvate phosphate dikinase [Sulfitobacter donghicola DSW-25 = KCTC 12864 = JCM 14565]KIN66834.1 Pyruvate phosphate dikinase [Sulfitobacter donghicola DSW-25 = KCTC 12864 = JCM 14565]
MQSDPNTTYVTQTAPIATETHGGRAKCLQRLVRLDLPVPATVALSFTTVGNIANGELPDVDAVVDQFPKDALLCVRPSSQDPDWGGPGAVLNIGMNDARFENFSKVMGEDAAAALYTRFIQSYAINVARLDPDMFDDVQGEGRRALEETISAYEHETEEKFPQSRRTQLAAVLRSMARAWNGTSARLLRQAKGAPADAGLGLVVQQMIFGLGAGQCGSGVLQLVNSETGAPQVTGRYLSQSQGRDALGGNAEALYLTRDPRGPSLEEKMPEAFETLKTYASLMRKRLRAEMHVEFAIEDGVVHILDGVRVSRSSRAAVRIAVTLAEDGIISREEALMRVQPRLLTELLHRQIDPAAQRDIIGTGIAASPGAATGRLVFDSAEAQASAARDEPCILVRRETTSEDVRGMHAANAILTEKGGITSHAAVIGRGIGLPCVVGASSIEFNPRDKTITSEDGRVFREGDQITVDGSTGQILVGAAKMQEAALDEYFQKLMLWATDSADIKVRANADTPADAQTARNFNAEGIGLCRTEHMFFDAGRLTVMREMIFADTSDGRRAVLERLLPMQREDFTQLFGIMRGQPVCIRLFDPPLHEFLPMDASGQRELAEALGLPRSDVTRRIEAMREYNPMLGLRGVRLGITVPEIYEMQARAIFEAIVDASEDGDAVIAEIMIPLVSARREVELVRSAIDAVAHAVSQERGVEFEYRLGVMVETPRAALRTSEIAPNCAFLSFGTNDLTQMTYGLSRDDAGRFMSDYVQQGVFDEDPFHTLDYDGVGELLTLGAQRGRASQPDITLSVCGEHGGNPESIAFCREAGFDYVSCSPFRVPVARLAAAQLAIADKIG